MRIRKTWSYPYLAKLWAPTFINNWRKIQDIESTTIYTIYYHLRVHFKLHISQLKTRTHWRENNSPSVSPKSTSNDGDGHSILTCKKRPLSSLIHISRPTLFTFGWAPIYSNVVFGWNVSRSSTVYHSKMDVLKL